MGSTAVAQKSGSSKKDLEHTVGTMLTSIELMQHLMGDELTTAKDKLIEQLKEYTADVDMALGSKQVSMLMLAVQIRDLVKDSQKQAFNDVIAALVDKGADLTARQFEALHRKEVKNFLGLGDENRAQLKSLLFSYVKPTKNFLGLKVEKPNEAIVLEILRDLHSWDCGIYNKKPASNRALSEEVEQDELQETLNLMHKGASPVNIITKLHQAMQGCSKQDAFTLLVQECMKLMDDSAPAPTPPVKSVDTRFIL
ncbi:MAG: hypothetical protein DHS20C10_03370 [marine bacterium B5-7]|nr:MAG: hypothetical protein DHS20C10_03370 [marine bacterium B5-7]